MATTVNSTVTGAGDGAARSGELLAMARELRIWLIAIVVACVVAATAVAFLMRPVYRAETVVLPLSQEGDMGLLASMASQLGSLGSIAGLELGGDGMKESSIATLRSRTFTTEFIAEENLLVRIFEDDWEADIGTWDLADDEVPTLWEAQKEFDEEIRDVGENRRTGLVTVAIEWRDPQEAADWANELVARANRRIRADVIREAEKGLAFLDKELETTRTMELRQAIFKLAESETRRIMVANVREDYAFRVIDPAIPPDLDDYERPQRVALIIAGLLAGLALALAVVLVTASLRRNARS